jgi:iron complex outermembrane receptor protein
MGIEAEVSYSLNNGVYFGASGLLIKSEVDNKGEWQKQEISNASPSKLVTYIGYNVQNWSFRFQSLQNFKQKDELNNVLKATILRI